MPQMKIEKKYFPVRVDEFLQHITSLINQFLAIAEFQENKEFSKNIMAGGEE